MAKTPESSRSFALIISTLTLSGCQALAPFIQPSGGQSASANEAQSEWQQRERRWEQRQAEEEALEQKGLEKFRALEARAAPDQHSELLEATGFECDGSFIVVKGSRLPLTIHATGYDAPESVLYTRHFEITEVRPKPTIDLITYRLTEQSRLNGITAHQQVEFVSYGHVRGGSASIDSRTGEILAARMSEWSRSNYGKVYNYKIKNGKNKYSRINKPASRAVVGTYLFEEYSPGDVCQFYKSIVRASQ